MAGQPLPHGWEAKFDATTGRYFFIDHINKKTSWQDPRTMMQVPQQPAAPRSPARSPRQETIQMTPVSKPKCKTCHVREVNQQGWECWTCQQNRRVASQQQQQHDHTRRQPQPQPQLRQGEQDTSFSVDTAALNRLCHAYPAAKRDIISTTLELLMNDERETAETLESMGYQKRGAAPKASPTKTAPKRASPKKTTPQPPQLTEAQKNKVKADVKAQFPNMSREVVQMALESADYDKQKVVQLLKSMQEDVRPSSSRASRAEPEAGPARATSPARAGPARATPPARGTSPARFDSSSGSQPVQFSSTLQAPVFGDDSSSRSQRAKSPDSRRPAASRTAEPFRMIVASSSSSSSVQSRLKTTKPTTRAPVTTRTTPKSVGGYVSPLRNKANGPDPTLYNGPNRELLQKDYVDLCGPDLGNVWGPNPEYVKGPALREGATPHLAQGPNPELMRGPEQLWI